MKEEKREKKGRKKQETNFERKEKSEKQKRYQKREEREKRRRKSSKEEKSKRKEVKKNSKKTKNKQNRKDLPSRLKSNSRIKFLQQTNERLFKNLKTLHKIWSLPHYHLTNLNHSKWTILHLRIHFGN